MHQAILHLINEIIQLSDADIELITKHLNIKELRKNQPFIKEGQLNTFVGFLTEGLLRAYYIDTEGNDITTGFIEKNAFFTDLNSFQKSQPSERTIEALQPSQFYLFTQTELAILRHSIKNWTFFEQTYYGNVLKDKVNFQRKISLGNTTEAYQLFVETYPDAAMFAPKQYIASFLGMSPYTLSRIKL